LFWFLLLFSLIEKRKKYRKQREKSGMNEKKGIKKQVWKKNNETETFRWERTRKMEPRGIGRKKERKWVERDGEKKKRENEVEKKMKKNVCLLERWLFHKGSEKEVEMMCFEKFQLNIFSTEK
jgi:hypothetical protein